MSKPWYATAKVTLAASARLSCVADTVEEAMDKFKNTEDIDDIWAVTPLSVKDIVCYYQDDDGA
jgi:hypothetical protein